MQPMQSVQGINKNKDYYLKIQQQLKKTVFKNGLGTGLVEACTEAPLGPLGGRVETVEGANSHLEDEAAEVPCLDARFTQQIGL